MDKTSAARMAEVIAEMRAQVSHLRDIRVVLNGKEFNGNQVCKWADRLDALAAGMGEAGPVGPFLTAHEVREAIRAGTQVYCYSAPDEMRWDPCGMEDIPAPNSDWPDNFIKMGVLYRLASPPMTASPTPKPAGLSEVGTMVVVDDCGFPDWDDAAIAKMRDGDYTILLRRLTGATP